MWGTEQKHKTTLSKKAEIKKNIVEYLLRQTSSGFETIFKHSDAALSLSDDTSVSSPGVIESVWADKELPEDSSQHPKHNSQSKQGVLQSMLKD